MTLSEASVVGMMRAGRAFKICFKILIKGRVFIYNVFNFITHNPSKTEYLLSQINLITQYGTALITHCQTGL